MKRGLRILDSQGGSARLKKRVGIALVILIIALIAFSVYFLFYFERACDNSTCFVDSMRSCKKVTWTRADEQAVWRYSIVGNAPGDACEIEVTLVEMGEGTLESSVLQGNQMNCNMQKGDTQFPEKDISKCTGLLKENLQDIIIQRMHNYLLENIGEIKTEFETL